MSIIFIIFKMSSNPLLNSEQTAILSYINNSRNFEATYHIALTLYYENNSKVDSVQVEEKKLNIYLSLFCIFYLRADAFNGL